MAANDLFDILGLSHLAMDDASFSEDIVNDYKDSPTNKSSSNKTPNQTDKEGQTLKEQVINPENKTLLDQTSIRNLELKRPNNDGLNGIASKEHLRKPDNAKLDMIRRFDRSSNKNANDINDDHKLDVGMSKARGYSAEEGVKDPRKPYALTSVENFKGAHDETDKMKNMFNHSKPDNQVKDITYRVIESSKACRPIHPPYIPPEIDESEEGLFKVSGKGENFDKLANCKVEVSGQNVSAKPIHRFEDANLTPKILENIKKLDYTTLTPVQQWSIPIILSGRDLMASAQTGSGKTAAFLIPILSKLIHDKELLRTCAGSDICTPAVLIVSPTRELAQQIHMETRKFSHGTIVKSVSVYGGLDRTYQLKQMRGAAMVIGTVGRLIDFVRSGKIDLSAVQFLVLDEADMMLDLGFHDEVFGIVAKCGGQAKKNMQRIMFSATFPIEIQKLAYNILNDYVFVTVGMLGQANENIKQVVLKVDARHKKEKLIEVLKEIGNEKAIVFCQTKRNTDFLCISLGDFLDKNISAIHGDLSQMEREQAVGFLREGKVDVLMATSVAARGLDIEGVKHVINYDLPKDINEYIHRIGRTARCGYTGRALSFFSFPEDVELAKPLLRVLSETQQEVPRWLENAASSNPSRQTYTSRTTDGRRDGRFQVRRRDDAENESYNKPTQNQPVDDDWM